MFRPVQRLFSGCFGGLVPASYYLVVSTNGRCGRIEYLRGISPCSPSSRGYLAATCRLHVPKGRLSLEATSACPSHRQRIRESRTCKLPDFESRLRAVGNNLVVHAGFRISTRVPHFPSFFVFLFELLTRLSCLCGTRFTHFVFVHAILHTTNYYEVFTTTHYH